MYYSWVEFQLTFSILWLSILRTRYTRTLGIRTTWHLRSRRLMRFVARRTMRLKSRRPAVPHNIQMSHTCITSCCNYGQIDRLWVQNTAEIHCLLHAFLSPWFISELKPVRIHITPSDNATQLSRLSIVIAIYSSCFPYGDNVKTSIFPSFSIARQTLCFMFVISRLQYHKAHL